MAATLGGLYLLVRYGLPQLWEKINPIPPIEPPAAQISVSDITLDRLQQFDVSIVGMRPGEFYYGWATAETQNIIYEKKLTAGNLYAVRIPYVIHEQVKATTQPGGYFIYADQSPFGGPYVRVSVSVIS